MHNLLTGSYLCMQANEIVPEGSRGLAHLVSELKQTPPEDVDLMVMDSSQTEDETPRSRKDDENLLAAKLHSSSGSSSDADGDENLLVKVMKEKLCGEVAHHI